jgi:formylmethanofuran dehydrogenase subunit E
VGGLGLAHFIRSHSLLFGGYPMKKQQVCKQQFLTLCKCKICGDKFVISSEATNVSKTLCQYCEDKEKRSVIKK